MWWGTCPQLSSVLINVVRTFSRHEADTNAAKSGMNTSVDGSKLVPQPHPSQGGKKPTTTPRRILDREPKMSWGRSTCLPLKRTFCTTSRKFKVTESSVQFTVMVQHHSAVCFTLRFKTCDVAAPSFFKSGKTTLMGITCVL